MTTRIALALGSGGARGYAHIGVIEALEDRGYEIVNVAGTSMGALVGGLHAAGGLPAYAEWARGLTQRDVIRLLDPSFRTPGVIKAERIMAKVTELVGSRRIEDLPIPFTAVATDLVARREVWFQRGPLDAAVRASIALPSLISPVVVNGRLLADGGLMNPIPVAATSGAQADLTVAVSLAGDDPSGVGRGPARGASAEPRPAEEWMDRFRRSAAALMDNDLLRRFTARRNANGSEALEEAEDDAVLDTFGALPPGLRTLDVMELSLEALQSVVARYSLASYPPDLVITIPKAVARAFEFHRATELIELGRRLTEEALERLSPPS